MSADIDRSRSAISSSDGLEKVETGRASACGSLAFPTFAAGRPFSPVWESVFMDWENFLRLSRPSCGGDPPPAEVEDGVERETLLPWVFPDRSMDLCLSMPSFTM